MEFLADIANGDARSALNAIELGILTTDRSDDGLIHIDLKTAEQCIQKRAVRYDKTGDRKSTRLNSSHMSESRMPSSA